MPPAYRVPPLPRSEAGQRLRWLLLALPLLAAAGWWVGQALPDAATLRAHRGSLLALQAGAPWVFAAGYAALFVLWSALALPGCSLLALAAGLCWGTAAGTLIVTLAASAGATLAFLAARHWARDAVHRRWGSRLAALDAGLARDGAWWLLSLRLLPLIPYPVLNPLMGLTGMGTARFFWVSALGMAAGSAVYVHAGTLLHEPAGGSLGPALAGLGALALLPLGARALLRRRAGARA